MSGARRDAAVSEFFDERFANLFGVPSGKGHHGRSRAADKNSGKSLLPIFEALHNPWN